MARRNWRWRLVGNAVTTKVVEWLGGTLANGSGNDPEGVRLLAKGEPWPNAAMGRDGARFEVVSSKWPVSRKMQSIESFLRFEPRQLSYKATSGFWERLRNSSLEYPPDFGRALTIHIKRVKSGL